MTAPVLFTPTREAVTKLLIASTDIGEAAFHFGNALKRINEAQQLAAPGSALSIGCACLRFLAAVTPPRPLFDSLRSSILKLATTHYPEVLTEEI